MTKKVALLFEKFRKHEQDTGSVEVQIVKLTEDIKFLHEHCEQNPKDFSSKRGLIQKVNQRKKFLVYIKKNNESIYKGLVKELNLRK